MFIEAIVQTPQEALRAEELGVDRIELVSGMKEGGLTPSYATIKQVLNEISIPVQIMIRPHSYHFSYDERDLETIYEDIRNVIHLGGKGIVFGALNQDKTINMYALETIASISNELSITFHRAFDEVPSQEKAYYSIASSKNVRRILTSGGKADCMEGKEQLRRLVALSDETGGPKILPGGGLNVDNINEIHRHVEADQYHFGSGLQVEGDFSKGLDREKVRIVKNNTKI